MFIKANPALLKRLLCLGALAVAFSALSTPAAPRAIAAPSAVSFTVDTTLDLIDSDTTDGLCPPGNCSLRAAIMQANVIPGIEVTIVLPSGIYTLTRPPSGEDGPDNGDLNLTTPLIDNPYITITGASAATTIIDANQIDRVLSVDANRAANISGVTIRNGLRLGQLGAGIYNSGILSIADCVIEGNQNNNAGGGIYNYGTLNLTRSTIRANLGSVGGGLYVYGPTTIRDSTLSDNGAVYGGGIATSALGINANLYIVNSTISRNYANADGGGIFNQGSSFVYNTTIVDNDADHDRDVQGGIGGGVSVFSGSRFLVVNTLIARNTILNSPIYDDCNGALEVYGWNLLGDLTGCTFTGNGVDGRGLIALNSFGPLQNNGGATQTHALLAGSTAINDTFVQGCVDENGAPLTTDQRGVPRGVRYYCDIGAFEYIPLTLTFLPAIRR